MAFTADLLGKDEKLRPRCVKTGVGWAAQQRDYTPAWCGSRTDSLKNYHYFFIFPVDSRF